MKFEDSYPVIIEVQGMNIVLYFPNVQLRRAFRATHACRCMGRKPVQCVKDNFDRTFMNLMYYPQFRDFIPVWNSNVK